MYEFRMVEEVESGTINGLLTRPMSFYEYYLSQLMGYKLVTTALSLMVPIIAAQIFDLPTIFTRLPLAILLCLYYLILVHSISFVISCCAFFLNKIRSFTLVKNMALWVLTGELFPLDLMPPGWKEIFIAMPFASGVYIPVGYLTGRVGFEQMIQGFYSVTIAIVALSLFGAWFWKKGLQTYAGTGA
jgi:ABC-2 type transport system permease protein